MSNTKIFIAGHKGMVGSSLLRHLKKKKVTIITRSKKKLNLLDQKKVRDFFKKENIDQVYIAAARVGGIHENYNYPANFIYENLTIQSNIIHSAFLSGVKKILFLGSSCIYPKNANQPMKEEELLNGKLEFTNEPYAIAKIAGIKMCESYNRQFWKTHNIDYRCLMPTNLYGPGDNYHPENSHVIPALIQRLHEAKLSLKPKIAIWGTGKPKREFLYVDDMTKAAIKIMNLKKKIYENLTEKKCSHINVGFGEDLNIRKLAEIIKNVVGYKGKIYFDKTKPDGSLRKLLDCKRLNSLGWKPQTNLKKGLIKTYKEFQKRNARFN